MTLSPSVRGLLLCMACVDLGLVEAGAAEKSPPNILFIYSDDHSYRTIGCYPESYAWVKTPHIDRLAERGVRFSSAYIGTWCMPSRATLLTGRHQYGVESMQMEGTYPGSEYDPAKCPFWPSVFRQHGYVTAQIGKWHTGTDTGFGRDWDYQVVWNRPRHTDNAGNYYDNQLLETNGGEAVLTQGYSTDNYTDLAVEFINGQQREAGKPWYLWLCYGAVHGPYIPAERHLTAYPDVEVPVPADIFPPRPGKPEYASSMNKWMADPLGSGKPILRGGRLTMQTVEGKSGLHGNTLHDWERQYNQAVLAIDEGVGRLMQSLEESGQLENTLVIFTSDQGFAWGQHGFQHKLGPYDATIRSPMIVSQPGTIPAGAVCEHPVGGTDIIPTFFELAGIELPWEMHGHSIAPLLKNPTGAWPHPVLTTLTGYKFGSDTNTIPEDPKFMQQNGVPWWVSFREGKYKYIRTLVANEIEELYDLHADPEELNNLATKPEHIGQVRAFRDKMTAELQRTKAGMAGNLPPVREAVGQ